MGIDPEFIARRITFMSIFTTVRVVFSVLVTVRSSYQIRRQFMKVPFSTLALAVVITGGASTAALAGFDANTGNTVIDAQSIAPALPRGLASLTTLGDDGDTQTVWQGGQATTTTPVIRSGTTTGTSGNSGTGGDGAGSGGDGAGSGGGGAGGGGSGGVDSSSLEMAPSTYTTAGLGADIKFG